MEIALTGKYKGKVPNEENTKNQQNKMTFILLQSANAAKTCERSQLTSDLYLVSSLLGKLVIQTYITNNILNDTELKNYFKIARGVFSGNRLKLFVYNNDQECLKIIEDIKKQSEDLRKENKYDKEVKIIDDILDNIKKLSVLDEKTCKRKNLSTVDLSFKKFEERIKNIKNDIKKNSKDKFDIFERYEEAFNELKNDEDYKK